MTGRPAQAAATTASAEQDRSALTARIRAVAAVLLDQAAPDSPSGSVTESDDAGTLLDRMVRSIRTDLDPARAWLLYAGISTVLPTAEQVRSVLRTIELADPVTATLWLLDRCLEDAAAAGTTSHELRVVTGGVVVDVDFSSRHDVHTGIQRVVRSTLPHWSAAHDIVTTAWTPAMGMLRTLSDDEQSRVLRWTDWRAGAVERTDLATLRGGPGREERWTLVLPWRSVVVVAEVPFVGACRRLAAMAEHSGNAVVAIGYDCIPIVSADMVPPAEPNRFVQFLAAVKYMRRVAGISVSATAEFAGFSQMLVTQGLDGPDVVECALPASTPTDVPPEPPAGRPLILCIGSFEPRKNQLALLHAAEVLWREGLDFEVRLIGGGGVSRDVPSMVRRLARRGRPISIATGITDRELDAAYSRARFTVFPSTHEGYGLPIAESLAHGTPVITTGYGSTREIGASGGTVFIDPREDRSLIDAMRRLLVDDSEIRTLRAEIAKRPHRTWADYADDLWSRIVEPELSASTAGGRA